MPIYVYKPMSQKPCEFCESGFEVIQRIGDPALDCCPECSEPVQKILTAANLAKSGPSLDKDNIEKHGFTKYQKVEKGVYEKTAGKGPGIFSNKKR